MKVKIILVAVAILFSATTFAQDTMKRNAKPKSTQPVNHSGKKTTGTGTTDSIPPRKTTPKTGEKNVPNEYPQRPVPSPEPRPAPSEGNESNNPNP